MRRFALVIPERDRFGGLIEDVQSPAWAAAAGSGAGRQSHTSERAARSA